MLSLSELLVADTEEQVLSVLLAFLRLVGFEPDAWQAGSVPRTLLRAVARAMASQASKIAAIAAGGYLDTARSAWLDLLAWSHYQLSRKPAVATRGWILLTDHGGGPHTVLPGQLILQGPGALRFRNLSGGSLPAFGTLAIEVEAEAPGSKYNLVTGSPWELLTSLPTVTATNPAPDDADTWLSRSGADTEGDASLIERCKARWPGSGYLLTTAAVYRAAALAASAEVTRVRVFPHDPAPGHVRVVIAGTGSYLSNAAIDAVQDYMDERASVVTTVEVEEALPRPQGVQATIYVQAAYAPTTEAAALAALTAFQQRQDLGETAYRAAFYGVLMALPGVVNVVLNLPVNDVLLDPNQFLLLNPTITVEPV